MLDLGPTLRSKWIDLKLYGSWVPLGRAALDGVRLALRYGGDGRSMPFPNTIGLAVTNRCNLACECCYNRDNPSGDELGPQDIASLVSQAACHRAGLFLTGGEPLVRRDVLDILRQAKGAGLTAGLVTNGLLLDPRMTERLAEIRPDLVVLSVRGDRALHDAGMNRAGAYAAMLEAARSLATRVPRSGVQLNYVVTESSVGTVDAFLDDSLPLRDVFVRLGHLSFATSAEADAHRAAWKARIGDPVPPLLTYRYDVRSERFVDVPRILSSRRHPRLVSRPVLSPSEAAAWYAPGYASGRRCLYLWHSTNIQADGTVVPCQYYPYPMGNIREEPLDRIWNGERYRAFRREIRRGLLPGCARCCKL